MQTQKRVSIVSEIFEKGEANPVILDKDGYDINNPIVVSGERSKSSVSQDIIGTEDIVVTGQRAPVSVQQRRFNIDSFRSEFSKDNVVSTHSFLVSLSPFRSTSATARSLSSFIQNSSETITMRCDTAILPGIRLMKDETIRRYGYGPIERVPYSAQFNEITLNWILDGSAEILNFFNTWMQSIVNTDSAGGQDMRTPTRMGNVSYSPYELGYKDDYACPKMDIFVYDHRLQQVVVYEIFDVFPSAINDTPVSWAEQDTLLKYSIEFSYTDLIVSTPKSIGIIDSVTRSLLTSEEVARDAIYRGIEGINKIL